MTVHTVESNSDFLVPDDLVELDQWVLWRYEKRKSDKPTKVPYQVNGERADSTNPRTWTGFAEALEAWRRHGRRYNGIGFAFAREDGLAGIDLDDALDDSGDVKAWARGVIERFGDTYMEISPGGQGVKIWARGSLPANLPGVKVGDGQIEMYDHARYFAVTGRVFCSAPLQVENHAEDLTALYERLTPGRTGWSLQPSSGGIIPYGRQHNTLVSICGTLRRRQICEEAIVACLQVINEKQCEKPGPTENIIRLVRTSRSWGVR